ncbi:hypothetical protein GJ496_009465 [Pomphorhynchus laevis]|nr:hypothetical protein GJ496_009465 [Pomphorhynchus laevis]
MSENIVCGSQTSNDTSFGVNTGYQSIVDNLILNLSFFAASLLAFLLIRRHIRDQDVESSGNSIYRYISHPKSIAYLNISDLNPLTVIWKTLRLSLREIGEKCGPDSSVFLYFQLHLLVYSGILCILTIAIVLPINFQGTLNGNQSSFGFSTISNLPAGSNYLWGPIIVNAVAGIIGLLTVLHFAYAGNITNKNRHSKTALVFKNVPAEYCSEETIQEIIKDQLPNEQIVDIAIAYDIWRLDKTIEQGVKLKLICKGCDKLEEQFGDAGLVYHCCCGYYFAKITCHCCKQIKYSDASQFYRRQLDKHAALLDSTAKEALTKPTGIIFVQFENEQSAQKALKVLRSYKICERFKALLSHKSSIEEIQPDEIEIYPSQNNIPNYKAWTIKYAPKKNNILWQNLNAKRFRWYGRIFVINTALFILSIILTTPSMILNTIDKILSTTIDLTGANSFLSAFLVGILPPLILKMASSILPPIIGHSSHLERHHTRSRKAQSHIRKAYIFLIFTVLIIPSLGLIGINGFLRWFFEVDSTNNLSFQWQCIFLPDNGAFYVNYIMTSAFFGTALDLLRIPELLSLFFNILFSRSKPEQLAIYELERIEFAYCSAYASMLCIFSVICAYSVICPLITVFGFLYFVLSFMVDKYNIYFVAAPTVVKQRIHLTAFSCSLTALLLPHIFLLIFMAIKSTSDKNVHLITQAIITSVYILIYLIIRMLGHEKLTYGIISPLIETIPSLSISLESAKEVEFKRYYPNYLLKYVGEEMLYEKVDRINEGESMKDEQIEKEEEKT